MPRHAAQQSVPGAARGRGSGGPLRRGHEAHCFAGVLGSWRQRGQRFQHLACQVWRCGDLPAQQRVPQKGGSLRSGALAHHGAKDMPQRPRHIGTRLCAAKEGLHLGSPGSHCPVSTGSVHPLAGGPSAQPVGCEILVCGALRGHVLGEMGTGLAGEARPVHDAPALCLGRGALLEPCIEPASPGGSTTARVFGHHTQRSCFASVGCRY